MAEDEKTLRDQIRRYRTLHTLNPDKGARRVLEALIQEAQEKLDGLRKDSAEE